MNTPPTPSEPDRGRNVAAKAVGIALGVALLAVIGILLAAPPEDDGVVAVELVYEPAEIRLRGRGPETDLAPEGPAGAGPTLPSPLPAAYRFQERTLLGSTPFQHRLSTGTWLLELQALVQEEPIAPASIIAQVEAAREDGFLDLDQLATVWNEAQRVRNAEQRLTKLLGWLTAPGRDPSAFRLNTVRETDSPVGEGALLRVWTLGETYAPGEVAAGEMLLERLIGLGGDASSDGYDVIATPRMGEEVFPDWRYYPYLRHVAGFYLQSDEVCCIRTRYPASFRKRLLKHELLHAWANLVAPHWSSRFVEEGLAEYVSFVRATDTGLDVPATRFRDQFAALLATLRRLESSGASFRRLSLVELIQASPREFYALSSLGYLIAQACVAKAGGEVVEAAIRSRSEQPLITAISAMKWPDVLRWVHELAAGGDPARASVVSDAGVRHHPRVDASIRISRSRLGASLGALGIDVPAGYPLWLLTADLELPVDLRPQSRDRLVDVLARIQESEQRHYVTDATTTLTQPFRMAQPGLLAEGGPEPKTRLAFATAWLEAVRKDESGKPPPVWAWTVTLVETKLPPQLVGDALYERPLWEYLIPRDTSGDALVLLVSANTMTRIRTAKSYAESSGIAEADLDPADIHRIVTALHRYGMSSARLDLAAVLIVDLADGQGDALALAEAFAAQLGAGGSVAYWNPQQPLR